MQKIKCDFRISGFVFAVFCLMNEPKNGPCLDLRGSREPTGLWTRLLNWKVSLRLPTIGALSPVKWGVPT